MTWNNIEQGAFDATCSLTRTKKNPLPILGGPNGERKDYKDILFDMYGMTLFHILLSAATPRKDQLSVLLEALPQCVLGWPKKKEVHAFDYLSARWFPESKGMMEMALQRWMIDWVSHLGIRS
ncbi:unnamed protein product [Cylindrotheca closterium]|uniref:Uncharacterized protein n=1 Tax=Cylindrotheca closterium TaxID=2856 RepID=A0AAD2FW92_9STRA|nr:unnamed protein product [Cylindrotheca closterium]